MKRKFLFGFLAICIAVIGITFVLASKHALIVHPKGTIAHQELNLIVTNILAMLIIIVPTYLLLFYVFWRFCLNGDESHYDAEHSTGTLGQILMWTLPAIVVAVMAFITWEATHKLDPYKPIESEVKPLTVQVVALDWKWLFIYPEQGIATLNSLHFPDKTPIHLQLTADGSPMNSFWIPQLSGQIYSMTGMITKLHLMAQEPGEFRGQAVEINGDGYSDMTFVAKSMSQKDFDDWVAKVKKSSVRLTEESYRQLVKPKIEKSSILYSDVEKDLYHKIVHKYMYPAKQVL